MDFHLYDQRVFCQIVRDKSFSQAARALKLAQPTVSQKVAKLEAQVGGKLFERLGHEIYLTALGKLLHQYSLPCLDQAKAFEDQILQRKESPEGVVRYAMPESCQWTPHFRRIMSQISQSPGILFEIGILPSEQIVQSLLKGEIDFGFITGEKLNSELRFEKFSQEKYSAVGADRNLLKPLIKQNYKKLRMISHPGCELFWEAWAKGFGVRKSFFAVGTFVPVVRVSTLAGAIHAVQEGAGVAILPTHCVMRELNDQKLFEVSVTRGQPMSPIYLARRGSEKQPRRVKVVLALLRKAKIDFLHLA